jgi:transposase-like protein
MKAQDYQAFVEQLDELTPVQRDALLAALSAKASSGDVLAMIETRFAAEPACGHCGSERFGTWGHASALRRYKCKDCGRTFNALTGTPLAQLHRREKWLDYAAALVDGISLRKAAKRCDIDLTTSFRWRHRFLKAPKQVKAMAVTGIVEADETFIRKSSKGSRQLLRRARKRGGEGAKPGLSADDYDPVLIVRDRHGETTDTILPDLTAPTFAKELQPIVAKDAVLVSDGRDAYAAFAHARAILHVPINASRGEHVYQGFHIQNVNGYVSRLKGWMVRFKGVATNYLTSYLGWRRMIERDGLRLTPRHVLASAIGP